MQYDAVSGFFDGYAIVIINNKRGVINLKNEIIIPIKYDSMSYFIKGISYVESAGKEFFINIKEEHVAGEPYLKNFRF